MSASSHGSLRIVFIALAINLAIAAIKGIAALLSGSASMSAEAVHSLVDCGNQLFLLVGLKLSEKPASDRHPLGHSNEVYIWSFLVAALLFLLGGGQAIYDGFEHIRNPVAMETVSIAGLSFPSWMLNVAILGISVVLEGRGLLLARKELIAQESAPKSMIQSMLNSKDPSLFVVMFEDTAAVVGLSIAFVFTVLSVALHMPVLDGIASLLIGTMLICVAVVMGHEVRSLLIGEGDKVIAAGVREEIKGIKGVTAVNFIIAVQRGPNEVIVLASVDWDDDITAGEIEQKVAILTKQIRECYPQVTLFNMEIRSAKKHSDPQDALPSGLNVSSV